MCVAFLMSICLPFDKFGPHAQPASPRPCLISCLPVVRHAQPPPLRGPLVVVLVYSLSHDFAVKCLQNVCLTREREREKYKACAGFEHDF